MTKSIQEHATCRGCGMKLNGKPYYMGGSAYHPYTKERCPSNYYGGFVCSKSCDYRSALELEKTMPGHNLGQKNLLPKTEKHINRNWSDGR